MSNKLLWDNWLEQDVPSPVTVLTSDPYGGAVPDATATGDDPGATTDPNMQDALSDDPTQDPLDPDIPEQEEERDFEEWRNEFYKLAVAGDVAEMLDAISAARDMEGLESPQKKFVEDNLQVLLLRQDANFEKISAKVRKLIKEELNQNSPAVTLMQHISNVLETEQSFLSQIFIKLTNLYGMKADLHRKFLAALVGGVQVGGGGSKEDIVYNDREFSINISTRFFTQFGEITIGKWALQEDDPGRYLSDPELERLQQEGSPEEREALRHRIIVESMAERFRTRGFLINVVNPEGTIYAMGLDFSNCLLDAYTSGKLIVKTNNSMEGEAQVNTEGNIVPLMDISVDYIRETGELNSNGEPQTEELSFLERKDGIVYLTAEYDTIKDSSNGFSGMYFDEKAYQGNPSDLKVISRCIPSAPEILLRRC